MWAADAADNPDVAAEVPEFDPLVEAAGSVEDVPGFCAVRERTDEPGKSGAAPGHQRDDADAATTDGSGNSAGRGTPPTAAPGNPEHPAGPPANRPEQDGDRQGDNEKQDGDVEDDDSKGGANRTESDGQGHGGPGADRTTDPATPGRPARPLTVRRRDGTPERAPASPLGAGARSCEQGPVGASE